MRRTVSGWRIGSYCTEDLYAAKHAGREGPGPVGNLIDKGGRGDNDKNAYKSAGTEATDLLEGEV
jgi:hypothetical protein